MKKILLLLLSLMCYSLYAQDLWQLTSISEKCHQLQKVTRRYARDAKVPTFSYYETVSDGNHDFVIGSKTITFSNGDRDIYEPQCGIMVITLAETHLGYQYSIESASIKIKTETGYDNPGFNYSAMILNESNLVLQNNSYTFDQAHGNIDYVQGSIGTSSQYGQYIEFPDIKNILIQNRKIIIGVKANNSLCTEAPIGEFWVDVKIRHIEPASLSVVNNFAGGFVKASVNNPNPGSIQAATGNVSGMTGNIVYIAPDEENNNTSTHKWIYNDIEAPLNKSNWKIIDASNMPLSNKIKSADTSFVLTSSIKDFKYEAQMKKLCNVTFSDNIGGYFMIDNIDTLKKTSPYVPAIVEGNSTRSVTAYNQYVNSLNATFVKWSDNITSPTRSISPTAHTSLKAYYRVTLTNEYRNMRFNSTIGQPITITWNEHPNPNVVHYNIYRRVYGEQSESLIASVSRGTTTYTDNQYLISANLGPRSRINYDVRAVYTGQIPGEADYTATTEQDYQMQFGSSTGLPPEGVENRTSDKKDIKNALNASIIPTEYALGNYPNPFNPTTVIQYALPEAGQVSLKVYNLLSQEVASLVEGSQSAGTHEVSFNAHNLPTGIYIARLQAGNKVISIKLQLIK